MARPDEARVVYGAGVVQGIALVTFRGERDLHRSFGVRAVELGLRRDVPAAGGSASPRSNGASRPVAPTACCRSYSRPRSFAIASLPPDEPVLAVLAFAFAGLGCSALLPLTITFGEEELVGITAAVAGGVIAFYQLGYGIAAFGAGPLQAAGISLPTLFGLTAVVAVALGGLSVVVVGRPRFIRSG